MTNSRTQNRANNFLDNFPLIKTVHYNGKPENLQQQYIDFCEQEDMDPDCYTSALRWIENREK